MIALPFISPLMRLGLIAGALAVFVSAFVLRDKAIERRGEAKALAKVERATNDHVTRAQSAGNKSRGNASKGVLNPNYRD